MPGWKPHCANASNKISNEIIFKLWLRRLRLEWALINLTYVSLPILICREALNHITKKLVVRDEMIYLQKQYFSTSRLIMLGYRRFCWRNQRRHNVKLSNINWKLSVNLPKVRLVAAWYYSIILVNIVKHLAKTVIFVLIRQRNMTG